VSTPVPHPERQRIVYRHVPAQAEGIVWLHAYGNCFEIQLAAGEQIDIEPGGWVYKDHTVRLETRWQRFTTALFAGTGQLVWNRFPDLAEE
jgi:uncharacterized protein (AIM24 family)